MEIILIVLGLFKVDFLPKDGGERIKGITAYLSKPIPAGSGEGVTVEKAFLKDEAVSKIEIGIEVIPRYNRYGIIYHLHPVDDEIMLDFEK